MSSTTHIHTTSKILFVTTIAVFAVIVFQRYEQYVKEGRFVVEANTACSSEEGKCFVADCVAGEADCDTTPYKKVSIYKHDAPKCLLEHSCDTFSCPSGAGDCGITYCSPDTIEDGEKCL